MFKVYEIKIGHWSWVIVKSSACPLDHTVDCPAVVNRLMQPDDYVIWCESKFIYPLQASQLSWQVCLF